MRPHFYVSPYAVPVPYFLPGDYSIGLTSTVATDQSYVEYSTVAGYLALRIEPRTAQVYVDGFFVGSADDVSGPGVPLEPGPHRIELRAEGYETAAFDIRIRANDTITYTRRLERPAPPAPRTETAIAIGQTATAKTLYVIPRCYAGDRPPAASQLPERCRMADLRIIK